MFELTQDQKALQQKARELAQGTFAPTAATTEAVLTMAPPPLAFMTGIACLLHRNTPRTLTAISASHASSSVSTTLPVMP